MDPTGRLYDWQKQQDVKPPVDDPNTPMMFTEEEMARGRDRYRMAREISILDKVDYFHFWCEFMAWFEGAGPGDKRSGNR